MCSAVEIDKEELFRDRQLTPYATDIIPGYSGFLYYHEHAIYLVDNPARSSKQIEPHIAGLMLCEEEMFTNYFCHCCLAREEGAQLYDVANNLYSETKILPLCHDIVAEAILYAIEKLNPSFDGLQMRLETYMESAFQFFHSQALLDFRKLSAKSPVVGILKSFIQANNLGSVEIILSMAKDRVSTICKNAITGLNVRSKMMLGICLVNPAISWLNPINWTEALFMFQDAVDENEALRYPFIDFLTGILAVTTWQHLPDIYSDSLLPDFSSEVRISFEEKEAFFREYISLREKPIRKKLNEEPNRSEPVSDEDCYQIVYENEVQQYAESLQKQDAELLCYMEPYCQSFFDYFKKTYHIKGDRGPIIPVTPSFIINMCKSKATIELMRTYMSGKKTPKDIMMPVRAAIDAGVIRRPTDSEFRKIFPEISVPKSSFSNYTNPDKMPYFDAAYKTLVAKFEEI